MNLFIISNMGQLYQVQTLIRKEKLTNNILAVLYTNKNVQIYDYLLGSVDGSLFVNVESVLLPNNPNSYTKTKLRIIKERYLRLFEKYHFKKVFICSFESHYNFIRDIAKERNIKLALFEEGTATYKFLVEKNKNEMNFKERLHRAIRISKNDFKKAYYNSFLHDIIRKSFILRTLRAIARTSKRLLASLFTQHQRNSIKGFLYSDKYKTVFETINEFDEVYVAFPEKAKQIFRAKKYYELIGDYNLNEETSRLIEESEALKELNEQSVVFVNQRYNVPQDLHVQIILSFLAENFAEDHIFIKFHPKDSTEMKKAFSKGLVSRNLRAEIIDLDIEVPFEAILKVKKPKTVIGISSTSLVYTEKIHPETTTVSCANYYLTRIKEKNVDPNVIELISYHTRILESLSGIQVK